MATTGVIEKCTQNQIQAERSVPEDKLAVLMPFLLSAFGLGCGLWLCSRGYLYVCVCVCEKEIQRECMRVTFSGLGSIGGRLITL